MQNTPLRAGDAVRVLPAMHDCTSRATMTEHVAKIETDIINAAIDELSKTAYSAGFQMDVKSVTMQGCNWVILYRLENDPSFHPPM